jgi:pimeloyl-ACP methyl ester carboxylesterase
MDTYGMPASETDLTLQTGDGVELAVGLIGPLHDPVGTAVIAHGAGSSGDFSRRAFAPALLRAGWRLASYDLRSHGASTAVVDGARLRMADHVADLLLVARSVDATLLGGVSMGAHAAVLAAAAEPAAASAGLLLALPAWTGAPDVVAAANAIQAGELRAAGIAACLERICRDHPGWVADELAGAWPTHDVDAFAALLTALARSDGPTPQLLAGLTVPVGLVALADDPMHPAGVAEEWCELLPRAVLSVLPLDAPAGDRRVIGDAAVAAWQEAVSGTR